MDVGQFIEALTNLQNLVKVASWTGPLAASAFAGTLLGGMALSFFWKNFGPWMLLEAAQKALEESNDKHEECLRQQTVMAAKLAETQSRQDVVMEALHRAGLGVYIGPDPLAGSIPVYERFKTIPPQGGQSGT